MNTQNETKEERLVSRARGCLLAHLAGNALGNQVERRDPESILALYPDGVRDMSAESRTWPLIAGQLTDAAEMALVLTRSLADLGKFDQIAIQRGYIDWMKSNPFSISNTVRGALRIYLPNSVTQTCEALMRISPLGIFGVNYELGQVARWAVEEAGITQTGHICGQVNSLFAMAISEAMRQEGEAAPEKLYESVRDWAAEMKVNRQVTAVIEAAQENLPQNYISGWVLHMLHTALWQLLHAPNLEEAIVHTIMLGGDAGSSAAVCGSLFGALNGETAIPARWVDVLLNCRPEKGKPGILVPRPELYWAVDARELAERLVVQNP